MSTVQPIPRFIEKATAFLQKDDRLKILGLFRVSGKRTDADILREELDQGNDLLKILPARVYYACAHLI